MEKKAVGSRLDRGLREVKVTAKDSMDGRNAP
jgi:hypothetical protein